MFRLIRDIKTFLPERPSIKLITIDNYQSEVDDSIPRFEDHEWVDLGCYLSQKYIKQLDTRERDIHIESHQSIFLWHSTI